MSERAKLARQLRYRMIKVRSKLDTLLFLSVAFYLISIGCGELGPVMRCSDGVACDFLIGRPLQHDPDSIGSDLTSYPDSFSINTFLLRCGDIESNPGPFATSATMEQDVRRLENKMDKQSEMLHGKLNHLIEVGTATRHLNEQLQSKLHSFFF